MDGDTLDLAFGSHSELRPLRKSMRPKTANRSSPEVFVKAWTKVMMLDHFDVNGS